MPFSLTNKITPNYYFIIKKTCAHYYRAFHRFGKAKFAYEGSILGSSQFTLHPQLPLKTTLDFQVVKIDSNIIVSVH